MPKKQEITIPTFEFEYGRLYLGKMNDSDKNCIYCKNGENSRCQFLNVSDDDLRKLGQFFIDCANGESK